jgi:hypothetical protein
LHLFQPEELPENEIPVIVKGVNLVGCEWSLCASHSSPIFRIDLLPFYWQMPLFSKSPGEQGFPLWDPTFLIVGTYWRFGPLADRPSRARHRFQSAQHLSAGSAFPIRGKKRGDLKFFTAYCL